MNKKCEENGDVGYHMWGKAGILQVIANNEKSMAKPGVSDADIKETKRYIRSLRKRYARMLADPNG